ncbi:uncharacterized protein RMCC_2752 [Mycolicibacterium canariasense]|uniref:Uncharacterized protein n=1 Tax=Mycolicibacterium canariasense TaxID=228230 RepID=A0A100WCM1_MYCCR|nr:uncharacterized protein RMCC_2752 [Mycolicibacterium canariasense]
MPAPEPAGEPQAAESRRRVWSMPTSPVTRKHVDEAGRLAAKAGVSAARQLARAVEGVPPKLRMITLAAVVLLLGIVGAIALPRAVAVACVVVVVPVCAFSLGVLTHRWYGAPAEPATSDLQRSVEYVDKKLTFALNAFGAERHQHAMIALFQAKTAVDLTLGTEQEPAGQIDALLSIEERSSRPRIRAGSTLAAS